MVRLIWLCLAGLVAIVEGLPEQVVCCITSQATAGLVGHEHRPARVRRAAIGSLACSTPWLSRPKVLAMSTRLPTFVAADLGTLGDKESESHAINAAGQVVGWAYRPDGYMHTFRWQDGMMIDLGTLGGTWSTAFDINAAGQVVGSAETTAGDRHAAMWLPS